MQKSSISRKQIAEKLLNVCGIKSMKVNLDLKEILQNNKNGLNRLSMQYNKVISRKSKACLQEKSSFYQEDLGFIENRYYNE